MWEEKTHNVSRQQRMTVHRDILMDGQTQVIVLMFCLFMSGNEINTSRPSPGATNLVHGGVGGGGVAALTTALTVHTHTNTHRTELKIHTTT